MVIFETDKRIVFNPLSQASKEYAIYKKDL